MFVLGRNVSLDEASIACRSQYGRDLICFNPTKPGGKYHFRLYVVSGADKWFIYNFRIHCRDVVSDRITEESVANEFAEETASCSDMRKLVLELCQPLYGSKRIVNMDNLYVSPQLLEQLYLKVLYARGTARMNRKHTPKHLTFTKSDLGKYPRGSYRIGVCTEGVNRPLVFASWLDGSVVNILSNVDSTECTEVVRRHGNRSITYEAPQIVQQYNTYMQGVDRVDQVRSRFSIADGHSSKKWYKKLAMGLIDLARVNAFTAWKLVTSTSADGRRRDLHRDFIIELSSALILGTWKTIPNSSSVLADDDESDSVVSSSSEASIVHDQTPLQCRNCVVVPVSTSEPRRKRQCVICRWENRIISTRTVRDKTHNVSLCLESTSVQYELKSYMCPTKEKSCWSKFHGCNGV